MRQHVEELPLGFHKVFQGERCASFPLDRQFSPDRFWSSPHLQFFLYQALPDLMMTIVTEATGETQTRLSLGNKEWGYVAFEPQQVVFYGEQAHALWQRYLEVVTLFDKLQQPAIIDYKLKDRELSIETPHGIIRPFVH